MTPTVSSPRSAPHRAAARFIEVRGTVQGVGFRPFVWREAMARGIAGRVRNRSGVVEIQAEGSIGALDDFVRALRLEAPPLARVEDVASSPAPLAGFTGFEVEASAATDGGVRSVPPDVATCASCLRELFDPADRRYRYPFVNCTDCGPRFTIIESLPYDRERTSMRAFPMCDDCRAEYEDPADRRFHAEPIACPACGPRLSLVDPGGRAFDGDPIDLAAGRLRAGSIVALKGLGGFQLACDATDERAVHELRRRKRRPDKPFAVMVADLEQARRCFVLDEDEAAVMGSPGAPIVFVGDRGLLAPSVAPRFAQQGVMLPCTPLHHLLTRAVERPLVMTSGNLSDEPICISNDDALARLGGIADAVLAHDREIVSRYDDSVVRVWRHAAVTIRRARGLAPASIEVDPPVLPSLGVGAELHGAFCLAAGPRAYLSQHLGDVDVQEALEALAAAYERYRTVFGVSPELVAHDLHPDFLTTRFASSLGLPSVPVQHHHAHVAAVLAEHRLSGPALGVAFDGFGLGEDGSAWGGEFLVADLASARRAAHLRSVALPGGDAAVRQPWRMAIAHLLDAGRPQDAERIAAEHGAAGAAALASVPLAPRTSSIGRLFDAVAALLGIVDEATFEGHPAMLLEQFADGEATREYPFDVTPGEGAILLDARPLVAAVAADVRRRRSRTAIAGRFHRTIAAATLEVCRALRGETGLDRVCLSGGVFQNALLTSDLVARLETVGFDVFVPRLAPTGDGGIALGQVAVASAKARA
jgi:hydrogenase maturation protein HypF